MQKLEKLFHILIIFFLAFSLTEKLLSVYALTVYKNELFEGNKNNAILIDKIGLINNHIFTFIITLLDSLVLEIALNFSKKRKLGKYQTFITLLLIIIAFCLMLDMLNTFLNNLSLILEVW